MMYYLDADFVVHLQDDGSMTPWNDTIGIFNGKCDTYITGFRVIPAKRTWVRQDGQSFVGEMITPWKPYHELEAVQRQYEQQLIQELQQTVAELDAALLDSTYENIIGGK